MAVVNFINLATARAGQRAREVALRKVLGASRRQLIAQFLGESLLLVGARHAARAWPWSRLLLPSLNAFLEADMAVSYFGRDGLLAPALLLVLVVGGLGGLYPALYPLPLPAGEGAEGQQVGRRCRRARGGCATPSSSASSRSRSG